MCNYKAKLKKCDIEPLVIEVIKEIVGNEFFVTEIQKRIGKQTDSSVIDRELKNYQQKLKEVEANKFRLEQEIDNMPLDAKYRERKIQDMTTRLESLYETMMDLEGLIKDAQLRKNAIEEDVMTMENIYRLLLSFSQIYDKMDDIEKKNLLSYLIKRIDIYANDEGTTQVLKSIEFNFPIYKDGTFVRKILLDERVNVETVVLLSKLNTKQHIEVELNLDELDLTSAESKATYDEIKAYVLEKHGLKVSSLYISQVKRTCGLDVGQNYNLSKKEDAKVPQCPLEKEAAIMDALKHFQMI